MAVTSANLRNRVLEKLNVIQPGATASSALQTLVDNAYGEVYEQLKSKHLVTWASDDSIPDGAVRGMVYRLAGEVWGEVGAPPHINPDAYIMQGEMMLRAFISPDWEYAPSQPDSF